MSNFQQWGFSGGFWFVPEDPPPSFRSSSQMRVHSCRSSPLDDKSSWFHLWILLDERWHVSSQKMSRLDLKPEISWFSRKEETLEIISSVVVLTHEWTSVYLFMLWKWKSEWSLEKKWRIFLMFHSHDISFCVSNKPLYFVSPFPLSVEAEQMKKRTERHKQSCTRFSSFYYMEM